MSAFLNMSVSDTKLIFREPSLRIFLVMPAAILLVTNVLMPFLVNTYTVVSDYVIYVIIAASVQTSTMMGFIYAMVFVDEKDIEISKMYGVLPISKQVFVLSRLIVPYIYAFLISVVIFQVQPYYQIIFIHNLLLSILTAMVAPTISLSVGILSKNKMQAMTWFKLINLFVTLPLLAFFVTQYQGAFGVLPTHWVYQVISDVITSGYFDFFSYLIGLGFFIGLIYFLLRRFVKIQFQ